MATEKRLIDANALPSGWMLAKFTEVNGKMRLTRTMPLTACPTVDAVEVVRCKDCKHCYYSKMFNKMWCGDNVVESDHYCSYGERRAEDG